MPFDPLQPRQCHKVSRRVILTEGEFDAIAFDQMGFPNVVSVPNGAEAFSDEWIDDLEHSIKFIFPMTWMNRDGGDQRKQPIS